MEFFVFEKFEKVVQLKNHIDEAIQTIKHSVDK